MRMVQGWSRQICSTSGHRKPSCEPRAELSRRAELIAICQPLHHNMAIVSFSTDYFRALRSCRLKFCLSSPLLLIDNPSNTYDRFGNTIAPCISNASSLPSPTTPYVSSSVQNSKSFSPLPGLLICQIIHGTFNPLNTSICCPTTFALSAPDAPNSSNSTSLLAF
jgi:hypothetical protein